MPIHEKSCKPNVNGTFPFGYCFINIQLHNNSIPFGIKLISFGIEVVFCDVESLGLESLKLKTL
ncbi:hypothetical protein GCM10027170_09710 [Aliiglaciecola aliphaticivorans]